MILPLSAINFTKCRIHEFFFARFSKSACRAIRLLPVEIKFTKTISWFEKKTSVTLTKSKMYLIFIFNTNFKPNLEPEAEPEPEPEPSISYEWTSWVNQPCAAACNSVGIQVQERRCLGRAGSK